jgi:hypothetical protein
MVTVLTLASVAFRRAALAAGSMPSMAKPTPLQISMGLPTAKTRGDTPSPVSLAKARSLVRRSCDKDTLSSQLDGCPLLGL